VFGIGRCRVSKKREAGSLHRRDGKVAETGKL
jgi:hypothetical protein